MLFNVEERSLVFSFLEDTRKETLEHILSAYPMMRDEFKEVAVSAVDKLNHLTETQFMNEIFVSEDDEEENR